MDSKPSSGGFNRALLTVRLACGAALVLLFGCASTEFVSQTERQARVNRMGNTSALQLGRDQSLFGQELLASGRARIATGNDKIRRGERLVEQGSRQVSRSRRAYENALLEMQPDDPRLLALSEQWDGGIETIREGNALVGEGRRDVESGQAEVREGRAVMESAAAYIRRAELETR